MNALLIVGDLSTLAPCAAKPVLNARYRNRRHTVAVLAPTKTRTAWFGRPAFGASPTARRRSLARCSRSRWRPRGRPARPGRKTPAVLSPAAGFAARAGIGDLGRASGRPWTALRSGPAAGVLLASEFGATERMDLVAGLAALLAEAVGARFLAMLEGANSAGIREVLRSAGYPGPAGRTAPELLEAVVTGDVKALLVFGADPVAAHPGTIAGQAIHAAALTVVTAPLPGPAAEEAHALLPTAIFGEKAGTVRGAFGTRLGPRPRDGAARPGAPGPGDPRRADRGASPRRSGSSVPRLVAEPTPQGFFSELDPLLRSPKPGRCSAREPGTHLLLARSSTTNAAEGSLTGQLSWARYAYPEPLLDLSTAHAASLGVRAGDRVRVRSNWGQTRAPRADRRRPSRGRRDGAAPRPGGPRAAALAARNGRSHPRPAARPRLAGARGGGATMAEARAVTSGSCSTSTGARGAAPAAPRATSGTTSRRTSSPGSWPTWRSSPCTAATASNRPAPQRARRGALYQDASGFVRRSELLCVGCHTCSIACPVRRHPRRAEAARHAQVRPLRRSRHRGRDPALRRDVHLGRPFVRGPAGERGVSGVRRRPHPVPRHRSEGVTMSDDEASSVEELHRPRRHARARRPRAEGDRRLRRGAPRRRANRDPAPRRQPVQRRRSPRRGDPRFHGRVLERSPDLPGGHYGLGLAYYRSARVRTRSAASSASWRSTRAG